MSLSPPHIVCARFKVKPIWKRGMDYINRLSLLYRPPEYSIRECRIAAMAYEAGWKAAKRAARRI